ncbi:mannose-6-phosphate isomerase type 1 [Kribbella sp. VKM Ac-2527]|uniref:mannose-6-phosphate isomerase n=1 Tax=Kribbella caucasensis TaxID=2512215 RepID=A0A4R6KJ61_9ACTN|nr:mannose-6-phosphate isomerase, class I [Kribbella sp. VKM Ac-2527]TDO51337.1 mannose-6-phosphate isomerase type 1 [Kribbella sp. VKM Ac-2527]
MVALLRNTIRDYAWGSPTAIPELTGAEPDGRPQAELWMGAHESAPSVLPSGQSLYDLVRTDPIGTLGVETAERFQGRFPFLAKILAAAQPLSIQAHPSLEQAIDGYARDEAAGIPLDASDRNYRDAWPKPEILIALEPFEALVGFRPLNRTVALLDALAGEGVAVDGFEELTDLLRNGKLQDAFTHFMSTDRDSIRPLVAALGEACSRYARAEFALEVETLEKLSTDFPDDPGVLAALLLNRVRLDRFQAVYLPAGNVHAYLSGTGFEVMANSDNVLRGGLTRKHVDVPELVSVVDFEPLADPVLTARHETGQYETGCPYFAVRRVDLGVAPVTVADAVGPRIVACVDGTTTVGTADVVIGIDDVVELSAGQSAFIKGPEGPCTLRGSGTAFVVSAR